MRIQALILVSMLAFFLTACEEDRLADSAGKVNKNVVEEVNQAIVAAPVVDVNLSERAQIDIQIRRIEEKLKTNPTVKGWMLVGDAHMHLKRYKEAAGAYNDAYMLSGLAPEPRKKLKNAMYYVGLEKANVTR